jgi:hypothetical protein
VGSFQGVVLLSSVEFVGIVACDENDIMVLVVEGTLVD